MEKDAYRLGLVSVSFRQHGPQEILPAMRAAGLACIEWGSDVHAPYQDRAALQRLAGLQQAFGVACCSYGTYFRLGQTPLEELPRYIEAARLLGTSVLRLWCGAKSGAEMTEREKEDLLETCRQASELARQSDVTLCLECHKQTLTERLADALACMEALHSPHFRMYWQPFQWQTVEENRRSAAALAPYTQHIHVFHWKGEQRLSLQDGIEEWRGYLNAFSPPRTLLLEFMPDDRLASLAGQAAALRAIVEGMT